MILCGEVSFDEKENFSSLAGNVGVCRHLFRLLRIGLI